MELKKNKIIVFGSLPIATKIVEYIISNESLELMGVVINDENPNNNDPWESTPCLYNYVTVNNIQRYTFDDLVEKFKPGELDLGLSCRFGDIIKINVINLFSKGIINMHGGLLPEFAGLYSCNYSILFRSKIGGGTLHYVDEGIDTGNVIRRCEFEITDTDTGYTVFQKTQITLYENMIEIIPLVLNNDIKSITMQELKARGYEHRYFNKKSILKYKEIVKSDFESGNVFYKVRAFDFPGYEPAYYMCGGKKIYMRMSYKEDK